MFGEIATRSPITENRLGSSDAESGATGRKMRMGSPYGQEGRTPGAREPGMRSRFLSERDAATYLGMPTARLAGLRKFDLAMIEKGFKPHGPPPLWQGGVCSYASENLDEWLNTRSATNPSQ